MTIPPLLGIHHVTAICGDPQINVEFYAGLLGLRLVKITVNFDDPSAYHFYYGDTVGTPGTVLTFFPYPGGRQARNGNGTFHEITLAIPVDSYEFWRHRLNAQHLIEGRSPLGEPMLSVTDPDAIRINFVEADREDTRPWADGPIPYEYAILGIHAVHLASDTPESRTFAENVLGFVEGESKADAVRHQLLEGQSGQFLYIGDAHKDSQGGPGQIHHVAFRVTDDASQLDWQRALQDQGAHVSPVRDRDYFHSIYFREPGGALCEIATDEPGFTIDETEHSLGTRLCLPRQFEPSRTQIFNSLPMIKLPNQDLLRG